MSGSRSCGDRAASVEAHLTPAQSRVLRGLVDWLAQRGVTFRFAIEALGFNLAGDRVEHAAPRAARSPLTTTRLAPAAGLPASASSLGCASRSTP